MFFFTRTQKYDASIPKEAFKNNLIGKHVRIHDMDFEVFEKDHVLRIIPHAEQVTTIKTLPITNVDIREEGNRTKVVVTSKMRKLDSGGPMLVVIFCTFLLVSAVILLRVGGERMITYTLLGVGSLIFSIFCVRMQMGYFDYVRKVRAYVKSGLNMPVA